VTTSIITIATMKGGSGKSTLASCLAVHWHLQRDLGDPMLFTELFLVGSWADHERQHERIQAGDRAVLTRIDGLLAPGERRTARHALGIRVGHHG